MRMNVVTFILAGIFIIMSAVNCLAAEESETDDYQQGEREEVMVLTPEEAVEFALENNENIREAEMDIEEKEIEYRKARNTEDDLKTKEDLSPEEQRMYEEQTGERLSSTLSYEERLGRYVNPKTAEMSLDNAKLTKSYLEDATRIQAEQRFGELIDAEKEIEDKKLALELAEEELRAVEVRFELGMSTNRDVQQADTGVRGVKNELTAAENNYSEALREFKDTLGLDQGTAVELEGGFEYEPAEEVDLEEMLEAAVKKDPTLANMRTALKGAELTFEQAKGYYTPNVFTYRSAENDLNKAELQYEEELEALEKDVHDAHENLVEAEEGYLTAVETVENTREDLRRVELKRELGMATKRDVLEAKQQLSEAETSESKALHAYNTVSSQFEFNVFRTGY